MIDGLPVWYLLGLVLFAVALVGVIVRQERDRDVLAWHDKALTDSGLIDGEPEPEPTTDEIPAARPDWAPPLSERERRHYHGGHRA